MRNIVVGYVTIFTCKENIKAPFNGNRQFDFRTKKPPDHVSYSELNAQRHKRYKLQVMSLRQHC